MIINTISKNSIYVNKQQQKQNRTQYFYTNNNSEADVFVNSKPKQVTFGGFFDFLKKQKPTDEERFENFSNDILELYNKKRYQLVLPKYNEKMEEKINKFNSEEQEKLLDYLFQKVIEEGGDTKEGYRRVLLEIGGSNILGYGPLEDAAKRNGYKNFRTFYEPETYIPETKAQKIKRILDETEAFDLKSFRETFDKINKIEGTMYENFYVTHPESVKFVLNNLPDIFYTKDNEQEYKEVINNIKNSISLCTRWDVQDEFGNNLAYRAVMAENPLLIQLAKEKEVDFNEPNKAGECALDLYRKMDNPSRVIKTIMNGLKLDNPQFIEFAKMDLTSGLELIMDEWKYNVNTRDSKTGDTALIAAAKENANNAFKLLLTHPDIDVNAVNEVGKTAGMIAAAQGNAEIIRALNEHPDFDVNNSNQSFITIGLLAAGRGYPEIIRILNENPNFDINYITPDGDSVYTVAKDNETLDAIMENPNANPNICEYRYRYTRYPIFKILRNAYLAREEEKEREHLERLICLCKYPQVDLYTKHLGDDIIESLKDTNFDTKFAINAAEQIKKIRAEKYVNKIKQIIDKEGVLTLEQIKDFLENPDIKEIINVPLNDMNEPIGFFIADIYASKENLQEYLETLSAFKDNMIYYDVNKKNKFGQTLYAKAVDAENKMLVEYLKRYAGADN